MYTRILVPVDGSSFSNQMLPLVGAIAQTTGAQLALYRAVEKSDKLADVERELQAVAGQHGAQAVAAEVHGDVADAIRQEADRVPGTLVAITSHGRSGVTRWSRGGPGMTMLVFPVSRAPIMMPPTCAGLHPRCARCWAARR